MTITSFPVRGTHAAGHSARLLCPLWLSPRVGGRFLEVFFENRTASGSWRAPLKPRRTLLTARDASSRGRDGSLNAKEPSLRGSHGSFRESGPPRRLIDAS